jgi:putative ABC transport system permease protein
MVIVMISAFFGAGINIVESKRKKTLHRVPFYHRYFLDILLLGVGIYGYETVNKKLEYYTKLRENFTVTTSDSDFLMYISVILFALGAGMLFLRIYPYLIKLVFKLGKKIWPSWMYFSLNRTGQNRDCSNIMLFLILTISIGVFSADSARSINYHIESNSKISVGADIIYKPKWKMYNADTGEAVLGSVKPGDDTLYVYDEGVLIQKIPIIFKEMFPEAISSFDEIKSVARVYTDDAASVRYISGERTAAKQIGDISLMCIDPYDFAVTANSSSYMNSFDLNEYINALIKVKDGCLVSNALLEELDLRQGDKIRVTGAAGDIECTILAGIDSWPGIESYYTDLSGVLQQKNFVVANLNTLFAYNKILPYGFWLKKADGVTDKELYDALSSSDFGVTQFDSATAALTGAKNEPVLQGSNGLLSVSFMTAVVICAIGFLTYWIISIKSRTLQFGISRALGVTKLGIMLMLISEQILVSGVAFFVGIVIGKVGSAMFVPLLGLNYISPLDVVPFIVRAMRPDFYRILIIMCGMLLICFAIFSGIVIKQKVDRAIKLGEV